MTPEYQLLFNIAAAPSIVGKVVGDTVADGTVTWTMRALTQANFVSAGNL